MGCVVYYTHSIKTAANTTHAVKEEMKYFFESWSQRYCVPDSFEKYICQHHQQCECELNSKVIFHLKFKHRTNIPILFWFPTESIPDDLRVVSMTTGDWLKSLGIEYF